MCQIQISEDSEKELFIFAAETNLLEFIANSLTFCAPRFDTYAELVKDSATNFLIKLSASESSKYADLICKGSLRLIETLGELIQDVG